MTLLTCEEPMVNANILCMQACVAYPVGNLFCMKMAQFCTLQSCGGDVPNAFNAFNSHYLNAKGCKTSLNLYGELLLP